VAPKYDKPTLVCQMALGEIADALDIFNQARLPTYHFPEEAARSLAAMARYTGWARPPYEVKTFDDVDRETVKALLARMEEEGRRNLLEPEALELLKAYRFPTLPFKWVTSEDEAVAGAEAMGYPVVLKIVSPEIIQKFDVGGVRLNLAGEAEVRQNYRQIMAAVRAAHPRARLAGMQVQKMAPKGKETILGMTRDPHFGPLMMFGLGGTYVEIFKDVIFRVAPISEVWAHRMAQELKGFRILAGYRGEPPADLDAIAECLERLSQLVLDFPKLQELDINPLMVFEKGKGAAVLDARIFIG